MKAENDSDEFFVGAPTGIHCQERYENNEDDGAIIGCRCAAKTIATLTRYRAKPTEGLPKTTKNNDSRPINCGISPRMAIKESSSSSNHDC